MRIGFAGLDWDEANRKKCRKHGVSLAEIEALFADEPRIAPDPKHSAAEDRFLAVGRTRAGRPLFVAIHVSPPARRSINPADQRPLHAQEGDRGL